MVKSYLRDLKFALIGGVLGLYVGTNLNWGKANGPCMEPIIHDGDYFLKESFPRVNFRSHIGDVITTKNPMGGNGILKRLNGLPGDSVSFNRHKIMLNENEYWALGDNQGNSYDSRFFGPVNTIDGRIILLYCPHEHKFKADF